MRRRPEISALLTMLVLLAGHHARALDGDIQLDPKTPYFHLQSARSVGDRGEVNLDVGTDPGCGVRWRYHHAELEILKNRFGDVQFVSLPQADCVECDPIVVRWMHEPTGQLAFNVNVYRVRVDSPCPEGG